MIIQKNSSDFLTKKSQKTFYNGDSIFRRERIFVGGRKKEKRILDEFTYILLHQFRQMEHLFSWLSHCYLEEGAVAEDLKKERREALFRELDAKYCDRCSKREMCRKKMEKAIVQKGFVEKEDIVSFLTCHGGEEMIREANHNYQIGVWEIMLEEQRKVHQKFLGKQYAAAARLIKESITAWEDPLVDRKKADDLVKKRAKSFGIEISDCFVEGKEGCIEIIASLRCKKGEKTAREIARMISELFGRKVKPQAGCKALAGEKFVWMEFIEEPRFYALSGALRMAKQGEKECGEQFALENIREDCFAAAICDGLGSGPVAGRESKRVIELLEKLLESGILPETAIEMVRASMLFSSWHERYVTLDFLMIDLHTGIGKLLKLGAAESFLIRGGIVEAVSGDRPPVGILTSDKTEFVRKKFNHGDFIVMVSDGVLDGFGGKGPFMRFLGTQQERCPKRLCDRVMEQLPDRKDDCTILAIGIWNK